MFEEPVAQEYLKQLRSIPDLSIVEGARDSPLLSDNFAWYECVHFRRKVFDELLSSQIRNLLVTQ